MKKYILGGLATAGLLLSAAASATSIVGTIGMGGGITPTGGINGLADATGLDFAGGSPTGSMIVFSGSGDLAGFAFASGSIRDFTFAPFSTVNGFYSVTAGGNVLSFDLTSVSIATQNSTFLNLTGSGTMHLTGKDDTDGSWTFTVNSTNPGVFTWASTTANVPEPATLGLLGAGLLGLGLSRRRKTV